MTRPGVYVSEAPLPRVVANPNVSASYGAFLGTALRGPAEPTLVTSWADFLSQFGGFGTDVSLPDAIYQFFNNGGGAAYVARVIASDAVAATGTANDGADRLTFAAITPGAWGNNLSVEVALESTEDGNLVVSVRESIRGVDVAVERFRNLSMDQASPRYIESIINSTTIGSKFVTVTDILKDDADIGAGDVVDLGSVTQGEDGSTPVAADYTALFDTFDGIESNLIFNVPGVTDVSGVLAKVEARGDSILLIDTAENQAADLTGATLPTSSYAAVYYPWIYIGDPAADAPRGSIKKVPPSASVAGMILRTDASRGVFKAPAGVASGLTGAVANELRLTNSDLDFLASSNVNVIRPVPGTGVAVMGARTRQLGTTAQYISVRRTLNYVKKRAVEVSRFALFEPNSPDLWEQLRVANGAFLSELWQVGGLAGLEFSQAFYVKCDSENNTSQTIANGEVHVEIGVAPVFPAEFIVIKVGQFEADASVVVTEEV